MSIGAVRAASKLGGRNALLNQLVVNSARNEAAVRVSYGESNYGNVSVYLG